ncbi:hypothetical protein E9536_39295 [Burkholderia sp. LS-044]|uniref:hypothetical protein n=1 Tax=Burkholderia sp. LS-044 TaxID=1459967 RepID=UPI0010A5F8DA|nr:hypothetical protein [Burkholderia sp. LS-044]THJ46802.1 hypothetical protein E9536_39295 [Burkholderia sp. LS-044]
MEDELSGPAGTQPDAFRFPGPHVEQRHARQRDWPFYLSHSQLTRLRLLREAWGDDVVIQIYAGCVRIRGECGDWRFTDDSELRAEIARRRQLSTASGQAMHVRRGGKRLRM